jgi:hypothetical protein
MEPKEKAKHLLAKMTTNADSLIYKNQYAKECALIAVDEILKAIGFSDNKFYWNDVKQEIEKL